MESQAPIVRAGHNCWRIAESPRTAVIIDGEAYFSAVRSALDQARHSVLLLGWDFDPRTELTPSVAGSPAFEPLGELLQALIRARPELEIRILIWDMVLPISAVRQGYPKRARTWFDGRVRFHLDGEHPPGSCHHQKVLVIDDAIAFCGGTDLASDRWDTSDHLDDDARRRLPSGRPHPPRHDVMMLVSGPAAGALGDLARARWSRSTGEVVRPPPKNSRSRLPEIWPAGITSNIRDGQVAIARTQPQWVAEDEVRESARLYLESIRAARDCVYLENQYITSPQIGSALAERLQEADGPEVVIICPASSPSYFDRLAIDDAQRALLAELVRVDCHGRLRAYTPLTADGHPIIVHSKISLIDDRLLRVGSTNLNNRSLGFDTECDLAIDALVLPGAEQREAIRLDLRAVRAKFLAHHARIDEATLAGMIERSGSVIRALDALASRFLRPIRAADLEISQSLIADMHLGDPESTMDAWRPWRRQAGPVRDEHEDPTDGVT